MLTKEQLQTLIPEAQKLAIAVVENEMVPIEFYFVKDNLKVMFYIEITKEVEGELLCGYKS